MLPPASRAYASIESREQGLKHYQLVFKELPYHKNNRSNLSRQDLDSTQSINPRIYLNFACDRICTMDTKDFFRNYHRRPLKRDPFHDVCSKYGIRFMAINYLCEYDWNDYKYSFFTFIPSIEQVILFDEDSLQNSDPRRPTTSTFGKRAPARSQYRKINRHRSNLEYVFKVKRIESAAEAENPVGGLGHIVWKKPSRNAKDKGMSVIDDRQLYL